MKAEIYAGLDKIGKRSFLYKSKEKFLDSIVVLRYVSEKLNIPIGELQSKSRVAKLAKARNLYVWLYRCLLMRNNLVNYDVNFFVDSDLASSTTQMMALINRSHCLAIHCFTSHDNLVCTDKIVKQESYKMLDELEVLVG